MNTHMNGKNIIAEMKQQLGITKRKRSPLMESILCDEEDYGMDEREPQYGPQRPDMDVPEGDDEEMGMEAGSSDVDSAIDEIRQIALKTIAKLASDPTDEKYQLMKKIWQLCDKTIEDKINAARGENVQKKSSI